MTLLEVVDTARLLINEPLDSSRTFPDNTSSFWTDSELIVYTNMVQQEIQNEIVQVFEDYFVTQTTFNIVSGCADYTLPPGFIKSRRLEDFRGSTIYPVEIEPITMNERIQRHPYVNQNNGSPLMNGYYIRGNQLVFNEAPDFTNSAAIRLFFVKGISDLSSQSQVSEIPLEHHRLMPVGVARYCLMRQQSDTSRLDLEYEKGLQKLKMQCEDRQVQRPRKVKSGLRGRII